MCYVCRIGTARFKQDEAELMQKLLEWDLHWSAYDSTPPCANKGCKKRPDFVFYVGKWVIVLECDENYHRDYVVECEIGRIGILKDTIKLPLLVIRFNPGVRNYEKLRKMFDDVLTCEGTIALNEYGIHVVYIGYPDSKIEELNGYTRDLCGMPFPCTVL